ncbi:MAG TPA: hypothetical protein VEU73_01490 [Gemmatimonadales bacterium]|nr:hypothetical protein [Gemmatimonadales bacterium]
MPSRHSLVALAAIPAVALLAGGCSNATGLPAPLFPNVVDTVSLWALRGTDITLPSAYTLSGAAQVRTDQTTGFDFAFDFDSIGEPALFPLGTLNLGQLSGLEHVTTAFDAITLAPTSPYVFDKPLAVNDTGMVVLIRSRPLTCSFGATVSLYAKLRVLAVDTTARRLDMEILVDQNCGYRGLQPGNPTQ